LTPVLQDTDDIKFLWAKDSLEIVQKARKQEFAVIINDEVSERVSLMEMLKSLREEKQNEKIPVIILAENPIKTSGPFFKLKDRYLDFVNSTKNENDLLTIFISIIEKGIKKKKEFKLDVHFINPFINCSLKVVEAMSKCQNIKAHKPYLLSPEEILPIEISGTLDINSPYFNGMMAISFNESTYKTVLANMLSITEEEVGTINKDNQDGAAELINIIYGQTKIILNQEGYDLQKALPSVIRGKDHKVNVSQKAPILCIPIDLDKNRIFIQLCVQAY
ncbi:chemotaxis protein CheX, partial [Bacteriovoracaceae bacterium]|nr:chemotaxis protein CheX [Bacteriovoracaceae bacterium]